MLLKKIRFPDGKVSWTVYDEGETVECLRNWIVHLEEINFSPNTIEAYARHVTRLCRYLKVNGKKPSQITVIDYDNFLRWLPLSFSSTQTPENLVQINSKTESVRLSASIKNQIHLAVKSFYRYISEDSVLIYGEQKVSTRYKSSSTFKPFLEHINNRRSVRKKDQYFSGDMTAVRKKISDKRLLPDDVLELIMNWRKTLIQHATKMGMFTYSIYLENLKSAINSINADLLEANIWTNAYVAEIPQFNNDYIGPNTPIIFNHPSEVVNLELKLYWSKVLMNKRCNSMSVIERRRLPMKWLVSWHPLRHTKGTSLAKEGHDVLTIMMELGHSSPDMAAVYVNNRLELKKQALMDKGAGRFFTIEGQVDHKIEELVYRKDLLTATRVCGGACAMPSQIGDWCEHANACYTCKHFRADEKDIEFFKSEQVMLEQIINEQASEIKDFTESGKTRLSEITFKRLNKNKEVYISLENIINAIDTARKYSGSESKFRKVDLENPK